MIIRKTTTEDLPAVMALYRAAQARMEAAGNPQWPKGWPEEWKVREDIDRGFGHVLLEGDTIVGAFALALGDEPTYAVIDGAWLNDAPYGTLHRVAGDGEHRGIMQAALAYCEGVIPNMRVDTHATNAAMQHVLEKNGYVRCGTIYVEDGSPRIAYQKEYVL